MLSLVTDFKTHLKIVYKNCLLCVVNYKHGIGTYIHIYVRFQVLSVMSMKMTVIWDVALCSLVDPD
jgi:hypothetical protein